MSTKAKRKRRKKELIAERDGRLCFYCRRVFELEFMTLDHLVPKTRGGSNHISNLVLSCSPCNYKKGHVDVVSFVCGRRVRGI